MYPKIFGIINSYGLMIGIGVLVCLWVFHTYSKKKNLDPKFIDFVEWLAIIAIVGGFGASAIFQSLYNYIENPEAGFQLGGVTFLGGLIGGVATFLIGYFIFGRKYKSSLVNMLDIAPCSITVAHAFGRIGCFLAGCCYGIETDSWLGVKFPNLSNPVYPTQLFESIFLFILFGVLTYLVLKTTFRHNMELYLISYGVWRFLIEFIRGDDRGEFIGVLSPSQFWSIIMVVGGIGMWIGMHFFYKYYDKKKALLSESLDNNTDDLDEKQEDNQ